MFTPIKVSNRVLLRGGLCACLRPLQLLWALEARGFVLSLDAGHLLVSPPSGLTADDARVIRQHHDDLVALVIYVDSEAYA
jgi:hypothetical protein